MKKICALIALLLVGFGSIAESQVVGVRVGVPSSRRNRGDDTTLPSYEWTPRDISGALFLLDTAAGASQWQDENGKSFTTPPGPSRPTAIGDNIGYYDEPISSFQVYSGTSGTRPNLATDATINASLAFASGDNFLILNSKKYFRYWNSNRIGFLLVAVKFEAGATGVLCTVIDTINNSGGNTGFNLRKDTNGQMTAQVAGGTTIATVSSVTTVEDGAWHYVRVWLNAGTLSMKLDGGTTRTGVAAAAVDADCTNDIKIGQKANGTGPLLGSLAKLVMGNGTSVSDADYALWLAYNPTLNFSSPARIFAAGASLTPDQASHRAMHYDFSDVTKMWTNNAQAVQVANDTDKIGFIDTHQTLPTGCGSLQRQASAVDAKRPAYATNVSNSLGASLWSGTAVNVGSDFTGENQLILNEKSAPGGGTWIVIAKNTDDTLGSHILNSGFYLGVAGSGYSNPTHDGAFLHFTNATAINSGMMTNAGTNGINIIAVRHEGQTAKMWVNNTYANPALSGSGTITNAGLFQVVSIGRPAIQDWDMAGNILEIIYYSTAHSDSTIRKVVNGLATKYAIANVPTTITVTARLDRGYWYKRLIAGAYGEDQPEYVTALLGVR